jgi:hypothetical protein
MENNRIRLDEKFLTEGEMYGRIGKMTDRELQEFRAANDFQSSKSLKRIERNVAFWFYLFVASAVITLVYMMKH